MKNSKEAGAIGVESVEDRKPEVGIRQLENE